MTEGLSGLGGPGLTSVMQAVSLAGAPIPIAVAGLILLSLFWRMRRAVSAASLATGLALMASGPFLKVIVMRPRPGLDCLAEGCGLADLGFPSGHILRATLFFGLLALNSGDLLPRRRPWRVALWIVAITVAITVGLSRVVLGVHLPSDVVGGWLWGGLLAVAATRIGRWVPRKVNLRRRRQRSIDRDGRAIGC